MQGYSGATINVPAICEMIDVLKEKMGMEDETANNMASAMYNFGINTGEAFGPVFGGYVAGISSFNTSCVATSGILLVYSLMFGGYHYRSMREYLDNPIKEEELEEADRYPVSIYISRKTSRSSSINKEYVGRYRSMSYISNLSKNLVPKK
jgi:hypothetical protein